MERPGLTAERLLALFAAGGLLLNYPLLALFGRLGTLAGIPALYLYLFVAWALLIAGIALVLGRDADDGP
ncbi:hypothetical protein KTQ42_05890|uniref:hypothetical protein n=1 Tax=Noviherbaspirillum sp. L7-7A TaxID=2850560 RepID=UPI001C2C64FB|nr:hypothetical protein [Noviherbaspirillum sp. L7-7A]MBV0878837.1 hypothetical protein [Noviherbaspirillum sp. L7-7A]